MCSEIIDVSSCLCSGIWLYKVKDMHQDFLDYINDANRIFLLKKKASFISNLTKGLFYFIFDFNNKSFWIDN